MHSQNPGDDATEKGHYSDALAVKAIVPEMVQCDGREQIAIIFNHRLNLKTKVKEQFFVDFVGTAGAVQVPATLANSSTLILETPVYREPSVATAYVYHGINRRLLGQHRFEFLSRSDTFHRLLYEALDPISFMCEALGVTSGDVNELDVALAETFKANAPEGFDFLGFHKQGTGESSADYPTLLHFASKFGLSKLIEVILRYPGAYEACSMKNYNGQRPYNIAEKHGYHQLANELRAFHDQGDSSPSYIQMEKEDEDVYVKTQKEDGSYCFVLRKEGNELYTDVDDKNEHDGYYVKMHKAGGGYHYMPMKSGVCRKQGGGTNKQRQYTNIQEQDEPYQEDIYENINKTNATSNVEQDLYEDMQHNENASSEELYADMVSDENPSGNAGTDEEFYTDMESEGKEMTDHEELYMDMQPTEEVSGLYISPEQTPDSFGYVRPTSNRPVTADAVLFNRSASSAAEVRARQLIAEHQRKTQSLPAAGMSQMDAIQSAFQQSMKSGKFTDKDACELMAKLSTSAQPERRGSITSKSSTSTASSSGSTSSSGISVSSGPELMQLQESIEDENNKEEDIHLSHNELMNQLRKSKDVPPPLPQPDYHQKEKATGSASSKPRRNKTTPVAEKDLQGIFDPNAPQPPPPVQRRKSSPAAVLGSELQSKEPSPEKQSQGRHIQPIPEIAQSAPPRTAPRPAARKAIPTPRSDTSRPPAPIPPSERIRHSGVPVLPMQDSTPPAPARRRLPPSPRN